METTTEKTKQELKKIAWKLIKKDFINIIPKRFKIEIEGIDDDSDYFHPIIILDENCKIRSQADFNTKYVYGHSFIFSDKENLNQNFYLSIYDDDAIVYILNNFDKIQQKLIFAIVELRKINEFKKSLDDISSVITYESISKMIEKSKLKDCMNSLDGILEYLENKRISE